MRPLGTHSVLRTDWLSTCLQLFVAAVVWTLAAIGSTAQTPTGGDVAAWGQAVDPANDCQFSCAGSKLLVKVPGTRHALNNSSLNRNMLAPRVLRDLAGDFSIQVKVRCFDPPVNVSSTNPVSTVDSIVGSGILIWQDEKNFLRLAQGAFSDRQQRVIQLRFGDQLIFQELYKFDAEFLYLRVSRIGKTMSMSVSEDGHRWLTPSSSRVPTLMSATRQMKDSLRVGVVVVNSVNKEIEAQFDELTISNLPEYGVHDAFKLNLVFPSTPMAELCDRRVQQELELDEKTLAAVKEYVSQQQSLTVADRSNEDSPAARELTSTAWATISRNLSAPQTQRLAGLAVQRFGPRSLLMELVQAQLKLSEADLQSIGRARQLIDESIVIRNRGLTTETQAAYSDLRDQANTLLTTVAQGPIRQQTAALEGKLFAFALPGMVAPSELVRSHPLGPLADLISQPAIQQELRLSRAAVESIEELLSTKSDVVFKVFESLELDASGQVDTSIARNWAEAYRQVGALRAEVEREVQGHLSSEQRSRLQQLLFQSLGPPTVLVSDSAREALSLSPVQLEKLERIEQEMAKSQNFSQLMFSSQARLALGEDFLTETQLQKLESLKVPGSTSSR